VSCSKSRRVYTQCVAYERSAAHLRRTWQSPFESELSAADASRLDNAGMSSSLAWRLNQPHTVMCKPISISTNVLSNRHNTATVGSAPSKCRLAEYWLHLSAKFCKYFGVFWNDTSRILLFFYSMVGHGGGVFKLSKISAKEALRFVQILYDSLQNEFEVTWQWYSLLRIVRQKSDCFTPAEISVDSFNKDSAMWLLLVYDIFIFITVVDL